MTPYDISNTLDAGGEILRGNRKEPGFRRCIYFPPDEEELVKKADASPLSFSGIVREALHLYFDTQGEVEALRALLQARDGEASAIRFFPRGVWPDGEPGWYYEPADRPGKWEYLGLDAKDAERRLRAATIRRRSQDGIGEAT